MTISHESLPPLSEFFCSDPFARNRAENRCNERKIKTSGVFSSESFSLNGGFRLDVATTPPSYYEGMNFELTFDDLTKLAANGKLEKDGTTIVINRPVLTELNGGKVIFFLDETDPRATSHKR